MDAFGGEHLYVWLGNQCRGEQWCVHLEMALLLEEASDLGYETSSQPGRAYGQHECRITGGAFVYYGSRMHTDFTSPVDRRGTASFKWDLEPRTSDGRPILPMWVADMDFPIPPAVTEAMRARLEHPVFGYTFLSDADRGAFVSWQSRRKGWRVDPGSLVFVPGVMPAVRAAVLAFTEPGDEVVIQPPVYYPFFNAVRDNGRTVVENPLVCVGGRYRMDLDHLRSVMTDRTRMFLLCSPHNPVGRVWSPGELRSLAEVCMERGVTIVADEIHSDLIPIRGAVPPVRFTPLASLDREIARTTVSVTAPTKTFNIAGLASAFAVVPDGEMRKVLRRMVARLGMELPNTLSLVAATAALERGEAWLEELLGYLGGTIDVLEREISARIPQIGFRPPEGTYLAWLDFRKIMEETGADAPAVGRALKEGAGLWLSEGGRFGRSGRGFQRMNFACPRSVVLDGIGRMERAVVALR